MSSSPFWAVAVQSSYAPALLLLTAVASLPSSAFATLSLTARTGGFVRGAGAIALVDLRVALDAHTHVATTTTVRAPRPIGGRSRRLGG